MVPDNVVSEPGKTLGLVVKHPEIEGVDYINNIRVPELKHISIKKEVSLKMVKHEWVVRRFFKPNSIFNKWTEDTPELLDKCFEKDIANSKLDKLIRDEKSLRLTCEVIHKYYALIKSIFLQQISTPNSYPTIERFRFARLCQRWNVCD